MNVAIIGGHLSPALAVIDAKPSGVDVLFIGRKHALEGDQARSFEEKVISEKGIPFHALTTGRLQRKLTRHTMVSLFKLPYGAVQAFSLLGKTKPDVILSFGSYVSLPVVIAASMRNIPVVIHEQTLEAGLANKIAARFATKICISWESSMPFFPREKTVLTGNPIREFRIKN
ncbi:MAG: glycosyltransferase [Candidatus Levybacteria bacterium]|nr:glycosyltransferase [Candidatus Levybacteria bacterium]